MRFYHDFYGFIIFMAYSSLIFYMRRQCQLDYMHNKVILPSSVKSFLGKRSLIESLQKNKVLNTSLAQKKHVLKMIPCVSSFSYLKKDVWMRVIKTSCSYSVSDTYCLKADFLHVFSGWYSTIVDNHGYPFPQESLNFVRSLANVLESCLQKSYKNHKGALKSSWKSWHFSNLFGGNYVFVTIYFSAYSNVWWGCWTFSNINQTSQKKSYH